MNQVTPELERRERELEHEAFCLGEVGYWAGLEKRGLVESQPGGWLIKKMVLPLAAAIEQWIANAKAGKTPGNAGLALYLDQFKPENVAFITARCVLANFDGTLATAVEELAQMLEEAAMSDELRRIDRKAWNRLEALTTRSKRRKTRLILTYNAMKKAEIKRIAWSDKTDPVRLGMHLIELCAEKSSGAFAVERRFIAKEKSPNFIVPHPETLAKLTDAHERCILNAPYRLPMVVPPKPWTKDLRDGGYLDSGLRRPLVNSKNDLDKDYERALRRADMPMVYEAVNAVQATPWHINKRVHEVMREAWDGGVNVGKLPARNDKALPVAPWGDSAAPAKGTEEYKAHRADTARTHEENEQGRSKRRSMESKLYVAKKFEEFDAIYFPHVLDWRGRLYPIPQHVNPIADDTGRALLEFAHGVELGEHGVDYLMVHGANTYGKEDKVSLDKLPFDDRMMWVAEHLSQIEAVAADPFARDVRDFWTEADKPFMFLAFCFEWKRLQEWVGEGNEPATFVSHLPVSWDGSCNGLQHFSAMLRDPDGAAATNLIPDYAALLYGIRAATNGRADVYQRVADVATRQVEANAMKGDVDAVAWLGKVDRKIAKHPTMTLPYGSGTHGIYKKLQADGATSPHAQYLAGVLNKARNKVVVAAPKAMDWLQKAARRVAEGGKPVRWTTPVGFIVQQEYYEQIGKRVSCLVGARRITTLLSIDSATVNTQEHEQGISPNFVHSLDAAHLMRTVSLCKAAGIDAFAMVHDSYGTHAGGAYLLRDKLRQAFVEQYGDSNTLDALRVELLAQIPEDKHGEMPSAPPLGNLDFTSVLESDHFFD